MMYSLPKALLVLIFSGLLILFAQFSAGITISYATVIGILLIIIICFIAVILHKIFSKFNFPLLAWASTLALLFCIPQSPVAAILEKYLNHVDFLSITVPILTFAGMAVADRLMELKNLSYKVLFVAVFVFAGRLILSATFAEIILKYNH